MAKKTVRHEIEVSPRVDALIGELAEAMNVSYDQALEQMVLDCDRLLGDLRIPAVVVEPVRFAVAVAS